MPLLKDKSQAFPQRRISSVCNTLFTAVFVLKNILAKRLSAFHNFFLSYVIKCVLSV